MHRLFEFHPAEHDLIVSRILLQVHQAVDEYFPNALPTASARFAKTAFGGSDEPTLTHLVPGDAGKDANAEELNKNQQHDWLRQKAETRENFERNREFEAVEDSHASLSQNFSGPSPLKLGLIIVLSLTLVGMVAYLALSR